MKKFVSILLFIVALARAAGATFTESFSSEPTAWEVWNPGAFSWDTNAHNLTVTWDSRETNSFFYYKLPTPLTRQDNFEVELTLRLDDLIVGIDPTKASTFEICFGFLNLKQATRTNYFRGSGINATTGPRSVVEFGYFPDDGLIDATIGPIIASTNNQIAYSHSHPVELTVGEEFRIRMRFDAAAQTLFTTIWHNDEPYGEAPDNTIRSLSYTTNFGDFEVDAFSITSYSDAGQAPRFGGSILAHGIVDDVAVTYPDPPIQTISGGREDSAWVVHFEGKASWSYALERTSDFVNWTGVATATGAAGAMQLSDDNPPAESAFYRVIAQRP